MQLPKITLITPSYNQGHYIEQTIQSVLNQNYPNLEYIIVDGGSTDNTVEIIKKYTEHIHWWVSEPDNGQAHAINKGLAQTTGDLVNWINSDDYLEPGALQALTKAWQDKQKGEVFCGYTHCFWDETGDTSHTYRMGMKNNVTSTLHNIEMNQPGTFYRTEIIKELGGVNESLRYVFDNELWMRYLCRYGQKRVVLLKTLIAHFRQHGQSKSIGEGFDAFNQEQQAILQFLTKQTYLPGYLQKYVDRDTTETNYESENWNMEQLNIQRFHAWFANKYMVSLFNEGDKQNSKKSLFMSLKQQQLNWNRKSLGLIKHLLLP
ncbi:MAG: glycosyltransferase [Marinilabiliaceae bacterium]|nr:glycosyltransferase [Marinilabiliaceae bacterium]